MTAGRTASIHARLLNLAKARGDDFNMVLTRYAIERFLYRLSAMTITSTLNTWLALMALCLFSD